MAQWTPEALSASDIESVVDALPDFLAETKCPNCNSSDASMDLRVEDMKNVKFCKSCDTLFGIDDSMDLNDLRQLMEEGRVKTASCTCGNDDIEGFLFEECQASGKLYLKCMNCKLTKDIEIIPADVDVTCEEMEERIPYDDTLVGDTGPSSAFYRPTFDDQIPRQRFQPFSCECGNEESELFEKVFDASGNSLISVRCWNCDGKTKLWTNEESICPMECTECGNDTEELFAKTFDSSGKIDSIFCHVCKTNLQLKETKKTSQQSNSPESSEHPLFVSYKKTKVTSLEAIKPGDHIAWKRCGGIYSHHAIVVKLLSKNKLDVIHNTVAKEGKAANGGSSFRILRGIVNVDLRKGDLYICNYEPGECLEPDEVIARAESLLGEKNYNLFLSNCEHFATLCKTSRHFSKQATSFFDVIRGLSSFAVKGVDDVLLVVMSSKLQKFAVGTVGECTANEGIARLTATGLADGVKALSISGTVVTNLAVEGIVFGVKTYRAFKEYKNGVINWEEFCAKTADAGCSSAIRFVCTSIGGVIGELLIPVPFVGGLIGCSIGAILGQFIGRKASNHCGEVVRRKLHANERRRTTPEA